jgi:hypothetical protein
MSINVLKIALFLAIDFHHDHSTLINLAVS